ncbi:MAG: 3-methyl-2-oxobutanoate dehydrogenase subunit VorB [Candidatus Methanoplasma sp.]|jgi:2-oxoisovalerate ferredoxin oxidoreductase alpha subunit|nr:3-methyl-2-oxobutanoate dehydrogenase subunit VorB [Candidatus Methanoplasma sp.]
MRKFVRGNEAVMIGAVYAGLDAYFGYPITPASEIAHAAAEYLPCLGKEFLQAECETGSANMMYGAASAGKKVMSASAGPGMSLMQEGISYLAGAQLPAVIVNIMRAGPGLGNIYPEQGDYNQSVKSGGHGNYKSIVLAPASVQEMCDLTILAFDLAFKYRNPAVVLADAVLGQMMESITVPEKVSETPDTDGWAVKGNKKTKDNLICSIYLDADRQEMHNVLLNKKYEEMKKEAKAESYLTKDADIILTGYGTSARIARSAVDVLREKGIKAGLFRPITLSPFPAEGLNACALGKKIIVVEMSNGQYRDDVLLHLENKQQVILFNRMGGNLPKVAELVEAAEKAAGVKA